MMPNGQSAALETKRFKVEPYHDTPAGRPLKLLFFAWYFPPARGIASVRSWNMAKYLVRSGWQVTVVTPDPALWRHAEGSEAISAELERQGIRRIWTDHRWRWLSPYDLNCWNEGLGRLAGGTCRRVARYLGIEGEIGWLQPTGAACSGLSRDDVDVILATGSPFVSFRLARRLSERLGRPYVLDYRDPWTQNPHAERNRLALSTRLTLRTEARLLAGSAAAIHVSPSCSSAMAQRFELERRPHVITNGYDPEELAAVKPHDFGYSAIVYTGAFYPPKRTAAPLMAALKRLRETAAGNKPDWRFHYYGDAEAHVREEANHWGMMDRVVLHGTVTRAEALSAVKGATIALVITSVFDEGSLEDNGIVTGKVFEPLGLGTPILLIAPRGSDARKIIAETDSGRAFVGTDVDGIAGFLSRLPRRTREASSAEAYSWPAKAAELDGILRNAAASGQTVA